MSVLLWEKELLQDIRNKCEYLGFHSGVAEDSVIRGYEDVSMGNRVRSPNIVAQNHRKF
jgi:hypothetical protein